MARGFVFAIYQDDDGLLWRLRVDADHAAELSRGWLTEGAEELPPLPRGWLPRRVVGLDTSGREQAARVATVDADLWTGTAISFELMLSDGSTDTALVVARQGELRTT